MLKTTWSRQYPTQTMINQLCEDTRYSLEQLIGVMGDRDGWEESQGIVLSVQLDADYICVCVQM